MLLMKIRIYLDTHISKLDSRMDLRKYQFNICIYPTPPHDQDAAQDQFLSRGLVWFGLVLWHINHYMLFNDESIFIHIIIIMSCRKHGYPWISLATSPYRSSPLAGLQVYIPYPHKAAVCMFKLVVLNWSRIIRCSLVPYPG